MALSDLSVFSEYAYETYTEILTQQINLFNSASQGAILLRNAAHQGDYSDKVFFAFVSGLVRRRDPYGSGTVSEKVMANLVDTMVKVAAGTPPIRLDPGQFKWIQQNPEVAGAAMGKQVAVQMLADMVNTTIGVIDTALSGTSALQLDISGNGGTTASLALPSPTALANAAVLLGDYMQEIAVWVMHSKSLNDLYVNALTNNERLFKYGSVSVTSDPFGRLYLMSDVPALRKAGSPVKYHTLGLTTGAGMCDQNGDFDDNYQTINGSENIIRTYQAEWSYNLGVKGYTWDKTNGGKAPNDAALFTSTNWDQVATSVKDLAGVQLITK